MPERLEIDKFGPISVEQTIPNRISSFILIWRSRMEFNPVHEDDPAENGNDPPTMEHLVVMSSGCRLFCPFLKAGGSGRKPVAVMLHGFPGHEQNYDIAHALRRAGINSIIFHYRGSWGSEGSFSFGNVLEDVASLLSMIRDPSKADEMGIDPDSIFLVGNSMGGWAALMTAGTDRNVMGSAFLGGFNFGLIHKYLEEGSPGEKELIMDSFRTLSDPLKGCTPEGLLKELVEAGDEWEITGRANLLLGTSLLLVSGSRDGTAEPRYHHTPLLNALKNLNHEDLRAVSLDSDHSFSDRRVALTGTVLEWMKDRASIN